ncbi:secondary thiamine-phosphate synthase enzyme YjbQ [bacterium]|nr:secondary thiamine-phosphate synthase enzyme YjbQ [bacterium]
MKTFFKQLKIDSDQNNLLTLDPKLKDHVQDLDYFYVNDLTEQSYDWVKESGIQNGLLTIQTMHTTCFISVNELDEPCLLGDINNMLREVAPKTKSYLHNGPLRWKNLCADDHKCDRNGDAHVKSFLFGNPSQTVIVKDGTPLWGQWQRVCLIDLDGPRNRQVAVQILGE